MQRPFLLSRNCASCMVLGALIISLFEFIEQLLWQVTGELYLKLDLDMSWI
jgi:hypothetical protein